MRDAVEVVIFRRKILRKRRISPLVIVMVVSVLAVVVLVAFVMRQCLDGWC